MNKDSVITSWDIIAGFTLMSPGLILFALLLVAVFFPEPLRVFRDYLLSFI